MKSISLVLRLPELHLVCPASSSMPFAVLLAGSLNSKSASALFVDCESHGRRGSIEAKVSKSEHSKL